jgi:hypothetical protein
MSLVAATVWTTNVVITFNATTTGKTIATNGVTISGSFNFNGAGGGWSLSTNVTTNRAVAGAVTLTNGTLDLNGKTLTVSNNSSTFLTAAGTKNLTFNGGTLVLNAAGSSLAFNNAAPTNFTTTAGTGTGTINFTGGGTNRSLVGGGSTFNCVINQGGAGQLRFTGSNTFLDITNTYSATAATSLRFDSGTTQTVAAFTASGASGKVLTITSSTAGSAATLSKTGGGTVNVDYVSLQDSTAAGTGATWNAGPNSTNVSGNTGWIFAAPANNGNFFMLFN